MYTMYSKTSDNGHAFHNNDTSTCMTDPNNKIYNYNVLPIYGISTS